MDLRRGGKIALIDTEHGRASKYADRFEFDTLMLERANIEQIVKAIDQAQDGAYPVLVIDSLSHPWYELVDEVEQIAQARYRGNTWAAWSEGTPKQRTLIEAILSYPGHVIGTMRSKTEWSLETRDGKVSPKRVGLAPEQRKGAEYEFDIMIELNTDHLANVIIDHTGFCQDRIIDHPGEDFGAELAAWLSERGEPVPPAAKKQKASDRDARAIQKIIQLQRDAQELLLQAQGEAWLDHWNDAFATFCAQRGVKVATWMDLRGEPLMQFGKDFVDFAGELKKLASPMP